LALILSNKGVGVYLEKTSATGKRGKIIDNSGATGKNITMKGGAITQEAAREDGCGRSRKGVNVLVILQRTEVSNKARKVHHLKRNSVVKCLPAPPALA